MTAIEWFVVATGLVAIGLVNWWFFWSDRPAAVAAITGGVQEATVVVDGGYSPATVLLRAGSPARLVFDRREDGSCSEEVLFPDLGIRRFLPPHQRTTIELPAVAAGRYDFVCGMRMLRGRLEVTAGEAEHDG